MMGYVIDIETDGINATKIHCLSYCQEDGSHLTTIGDYQEMKDFLAQADVLIGHNIVRYDIPVLESLLGVKVHARLIDTLPLSWVLDTKRDKHGLESYGEEFGIPKPVISDWQNLTFDDYKHRCEEDVKINTRLWDKQWRYLNFLYKGNKDKLQPFIDYLSFKMDCVKVQEQIGLAFDKEFCQQTLARLEAEKVLKTKELRQAMPKVPVYVVKSQPKVMYKADGTLSARGKSWIELTQSMNQPPHVAEVTVLKEYEEPNPNSNDQIKKWLYSLGWVPETIKHVRDKEKNTVKQIPQIASKAGGGEICDSIKKLIEKEPSLAVLDGLSVLSHRIGVFKKFLADEVDGRLYGSCMGLTNTLRLQHAVIVNLPSVERKYGKEIRACLVADEGSVLCGSDLSGIEDSTKRHYIYIYDPAYVEEMSTEGFDPHVSIARLAGYISEEEEKFFKWYTQNNS